MYKILQYPDPRLKTKATPVTDFGDASLQKMIDRMLETLANTEDCGGLAATQLDIVDPKRITVIYWENTPTCLVNPEIVTQEGEMNEPEACMSVYPAYINHKIKRSAKVTVKAHDRDGKEFKLTGEDYYAKLLQHEIDHLDGIVYIDHLSRIKRSRIEQKIQKVQRHLTHQRTQL